MRPRGRSRGGEKGFALVLALVVLVVITLIGLATMLISSTDLTLSGNETKVSKIFYAADSGIEYCAARLGNDANYLGGQMPVGISSNYTSSTPPDIQVVLAPPVLMGQQVHPGDGLVPQGAAYGTPQIVESLYRLSSTASASSIQAYKNIRADVGIYPQMLTISH